MIDDSVRMAINKSLDDIMTRRSFFIEEFCRTYLCVNSNTATDLNELIKNTELVEERSSDGFVTKWYFRKRGE